MNTFKIVGIGTTRTNLNTGIQRHSFGLSTAVRHRRPNTYFGWRDGDVSGDQVNDGSIELDLGGGPGLFYVPTDAPATFDSAIAVGNSFAYRRRPRRWHVGAHLLRRGDRPRQRRRSLLLGMGLAGLTAFKRWRG